MKYFTRLSNISVSIEQLWEQLCRAKPNKSCGPNNMHPRVLREVKEGVNVATTFNFPEIFDYWYSACNLEGG